MPRSIFSTSEDLDHSTALEHPQIIFCRIGTNTAQYGQILSPEQQNFVSQLQTLQTQDTQFYPSHIGKALTASKLIDCYTEQDVAYAAIFLLELFDYLDTRSACSYFPIEWFSQAMAKFCAEIIAHQQIEIKSKLSFYLAENLAQKIMDHCPIGSQQSLNFPDDPIFTDLLLLMQFGSITALQHFTDLLAAALATQTNKEQRKVWLELAHDLHDSHGIEAVFGQRSQLYQLRILCAYVNYGYKESEAISDPIYQQHLLMLAETMMQQLQLFRQQREEKTLSETMQGLLSEIEGQIIPSAIDALWAYAKQIQGPYF
jgi:hypothetical protein